MSALAARCSQQASPCPQRVIESLVSVFNAGL